MGQLELRKSSAMIRCGNREGRLVVVSNRVALPSSAHTPVAGGLAVAMDAVLKARGGLWFGWSGKTCEEIGADPQCRTFGSRTYAVCDLSHRDAEQYYHGFANRTLWPICHYRLDLADLSECNAAAYFRVNEDFALQLHKMLRQDDIIWVHDYHLIPLAGFLRQLGCANRIGFFLHIPWPGPAVASALPYYQRLLRSFGAYDIVGFQTQVDADNFRDCIVTANAGLTVGGVLCEVDGHSLQAGAFPIGIDTDRFAQQARAAEKTSTCKRALAHLGSRDLIIGVDRLDYSKGLKNRVDAFATFLDRSPDAVRAHVTMLQITPKSRSEVPEYLRMQRELAEDVGRVNGRFGEVDWTPILYINKSMGHAALAGLYRMSRVGLVTPLRDGMNLVAKEYVAAQAPDNPGVLVLSQFAGAAEELKSALIINPYDIEATADAITCAFAMSLDERKDRWNAMMAMLRANSVHNWASSFLEALANEAKGGNVDSPLAEAGFPFVAGSRRQELRCAAPWQRSLPRADTRGRIRHMPPATPRASSEQHSATNPMHPLSKASAPPPPLCLHGSAMTTAADPAQYLKGKPPIH
jgi:trehalose 6-phosphate synthase